MARPKTYDREEAVVKACRAFWENGFQALGVRELERLTGINQFAIRSEFGGKEGLYLEALRYYSNAAISTQMVHMKRGGIPEIVAFFQGLVASGSPTASEFGCLVVNTGIENARLKRERLEEATQNYWTALEEHFLEALSREPVFQEGGSNWKPRDLAKALVTAVMGIHAQNRAQQDKTAGRPLVDFVCGMLSEMARA
ncbi:transcriptional regulator, TetR family [Nitratireductor aquibiodomus]|uniref:Transcriptional regulator, TetR family n=1 Tax=Nitratireductor aquibiodomus TaxID=204799 RepID=A0A1H4KRC0_9HYPH|nr:TetR family transcriptional regulator [Nitratireductor aquibiodomus]SEB60943.1 transcriptional regulator, TetR family [Nitratireductor aquibiodomus]